MLINNLFFSFSFDNNEVLHLSFIYVIYYNLVIYIFAALSELISQAGILKHSF